MNVALWIAQGLLGLVFLMAGFMKVSRSREQLQQAGMKYVEDFSDGTVKTIGTLEILGAIGLILPAVTGILPILTPIAAVGLILTMTGAALTHIRRGEVVPYVIMNAVLGLVAVFIAYGRFVIEPLI